VSASGETSAAGSELNLSVLRLDLSLGVLWRVWGGTGPQALLSWGIGLAL
jgi:hypothetical protein